MTLYGKLIVDLHKSSTAATTSSFLEGTLGTLATANLEIQFKDLILNRSATHKATRKSSFSVMITFTYGERKLQQNVSKCQYFL